MALRWSDIDLGLRRVRITRRLYKGTFAPPKSKYGKRTIPLPADLTTALWTLRKAAADPSDDAPVFSSSTGGYLDYSTVYNRILRPAQAKVGLKTGAHVLRHTYATNLFRAGWNAKQVQIVLGHHSPAFTLATYVHLLPEDLPEPPALPAGQEASVKSADFIPTDDSSRDVPAWHVPDLGTAQASDESSSASAA